MAQIFCDGACNSHTGNEAWGSVTNSIGEDLLVEENKSVYVDMVTRIEKLPVGTRRIIVAKFDDVNTQQNNGAELLAMVAALRLAIKNPKINIINCDSELITKWWGRGHVSANAKKNMDKRKLAIIIECGKLRKIFEDIGGQIIKISGDVNYADLGWH